MYLLHLLEGKEVGGGGERGEGGEGQYDLARGAPCDD